MAVPDAGPGLVAAATTGSWPVVVSRVLLRVIRFCWRLGVSVFAAAGCACSGYGSTYHLVRAYCLQADPVLPPDDVTVGRYARRGIRQLEEYLAVACRDRTDRTDRPFDGF